jgi:uncharacterized protein YjbI with pentapeptide repeats
MVDNRMEWEDLKDLDFWETRALAGHSKKFIEITQDTNKNSHQFFLKLQDLLSGQGKYTKYSQVQRRKLWNTWAKKTDKKVLASGMVNLDNGAILNGFNFDKFDFGHINFFKAHLESASFVEAYLDKTLFMCSHLKKAKFMKAEFKGGEGIGVGYFNKADLTEANFNNAVFSQGIGMVKAILRKAKFRNVKFGEVNFTEADLTKADFTGADISYLSNFMNANLKGARFNNANI